MLISNIQSISASLTVVLNHQQLHQKTSQMNHTLIFQPIHKDGLIYFFIAHLKWNGMVLFIFSFLLQIHLCIPPSAVHLIHFCSLAHKEYDLDEPKVLDFPKSLLTN